MPGLTEETRLAWVQVVLLPLLFYGGAKLSLALAIRPELVMLWLPNSILLVALLHYGKRGFARFATMIVLAEIAADYPTFTILEAVLFGLINLAEAAITWALLKRWRTDVTFATPADIAAFVFAGPVIAAFAAACGGAFVNGVLRPSEVPLQELVRVWWFSDGLGLLIMTPLVLSLWPAGQRSPEPPITMRWYDAAAIAAAAVVGTAFALSRERMFLGFTIRSFILIPVALYAAARFGLRVTAFVVAVITALLLFVTKNGQQPFGDIPLRETVMSGQELIFIMSTMALGIAAWRSQHRRQQSELEARVVERTAELNELNARLLQMATTDPLTGTLNRRGMFDLLAREFARDRRHGHALAVIVFDLDHFKKINDVYGHAVGDSVLLQIAGLTRNVIRSSDSIARYGGEEFVVIAPETGQDEAIQLAERIRHALREHPVHANGEMLRVTASFGVAAVDCTGTDAEHALRLADRALYAAKAAGRDCVVGANTRAWTPESARFSSS